MRLLDQDRDTGALLLEALSPSRSLASVEPTEALTVIGGLVVRLGACEGPAGLHDLGTLTRDLVERARRVAAAGELSPGECALLTGLVSVAEEVAAEPGDRLLHWDLHYGNVLAPLPGADRGPWLVIDPKPPVGAPGFELPVTRSGRYGAASTC
ncbi:aminoglycoside phosphotransferase family protein [Nocardiopsis terrae]